MKKYISILFIAFTLSSYAQDPLFTMYNSSPVYFNPANTGSTGAARATLSYRNQWPKISAYRTVAVSYDHYFKKVGGFGLVYMHDEAGNGSFITDYIGLTYSPHFKIKNLNFKPGVEVGMGSKKLNWSNLTFGDMIDPQRGFVYNSTQERNFSSARFLDLSAGLLAYTDRFYAGFSSHHLTEPNESVFENGNSPLPRSYYFNAGYTFFSTELTEGFALSPAILFAAQGGHSQAVIGLNSRYKNYLLGVAMRASDAFITQVGFQNKLLKIAYSYDYTISTLDNDRTGGSHEVSLVFNLWYNKEKAITPFRTINF